MQDQEEVEKYPLLLDLLQLVQGVEVVPLVMKHLNQMELEVQELLVVVMVDQKV
jgi:hypothetical protein